MICALTSLGLAALGPAIDSPQAAAQAATTTVARKTSATSTPAKADPAKARRIILVAPTSGPDSAMSADISKAARLAIRHALEDGLIPVNHGIEIIELDQAATNSGAGAVGRRLQKEPAVVAVIGATTTKAAEDLLPVVSENNTAFLSFAATSRPPLSEPGTAQSADSAQTAGSAQNNSTTKPTKQKAVHLQLVADVQDAATAAAEHIDVSPGPVVTLHDGSPSGRLFIDTYLGVSASRFVPTIEMGQLPADDKGFQKQAARMLSKSPRFIVFGGSAETAAKLTTLVQSTSPTTRIMTGGSSDQIDCGGLVGSFRDNDLCVLGWNPVSIAKSDKAFREDFYATYHHAPLGHAANAYRAIRLLIVGLKPTLGSAVNPEDSHIRQDLNDRLVSAQTFQGLNMFFDTAGRRSDKPAAVLVKRRNAWVSVW